MKIRLSKIALIGMFICLLFNTASAQTFILQSLPEDKPKLGFRFLRPDFDWDVDMSLLSGIYELSFNVPVSSSINLIGSLPFTYVSVEDEDSESGIGNIFFGMQHRLTKSTQYNSNLAVGLFLPTTPDDKFTLLFINAYTNFHEFPKYTPDILTIYGNFAFRGVRSSGLLFGFEIGPYLYIPTEDDGLDTEFFLHYGLSGGFQVSDFAVLAELIGTVIITEDVDVFSDRFVHSISFGGQWMGSMMRPGIFYKLYLKEELKDWVKGVLGIKLDICLP